MLWVVVDMPNEVRSPTPLKAPATPALELLDFLNLWREENYAGMARKLKLPMQKGRRKTAKEVRGEYQSRTLLDYRILSTRDTDAAATTITAILRCVVGDEESIRRWQFRMVYLDAQHRPMPRDHSGGRWVPVTASVLPEPPGPEPLKA